MGIHAIIWDIGGVLERTEDWGPRQKLIERLGRTMHEMDQLVFGHTDNQRCQLGEITAEQHWANVAAELGLNANEMQQALAEFFGGDQLDYQLVETIRHLKGKYCTAVLSNYMTNLRPRITDEWQIDDAFNHLIISAEVGLMKPDPAIYQRVLEVIGYEAHQTVFIDDFIENVEGARAVGYHAILFQNPEQIKADLQALLNRN